MEIKWEIWWVEKRLKIEMDKSFIPELGSGAVENVNLNVQRVEV